MIKILKFNEVKPEQIFARAENAVNVETIVSEIIENVRSRGDKALFEYCEKLSSGRLSPSFPSPSSLSSPSSQRSRSSASSVFTLIFTR